MSALWALAAFVMTLAGGAFAFRYRRYLLYIMAASAGLLIGVAFLDLIPEVVELAHQYAIAMRSLMVTVILGFVASPFERLAFVPYPGTHWTTAVAALLDGFDLVVAAPPGPIAASVASRLAARARQRGSVLLPAGPLSATWTGADLIVEAVRGEWSGLGAGRGRLRARQLTVRAWGRGSASAPRETTAMLPAASGPLPPVQGETSTPENPAETSLLRGSSGQNEAEKALLRGSSGNKANLRRAG